jgi:antitoxin CptB
MKELDVVLTRYLDGGFKAASQQEQQAFRDLLEMPDPDLFSLLVGRTAAQDNDVKSLVKKLKKQVNQR